MARTAVVTGCAGFIGSHLVDSLLQRDYTVSGIDSLRTGSLDNMSQATANPRFAFVKEDTREKNLRKRLIKNADILFHLAAISSVKLSVEDPLLVTQVNVEGTVNVLDAARRMDVRRVVFSSSAAVYGNPAVLPVHEEQTPTPLSPYAASKIAGEEYLRAFQSTYGIETTILRYFNVYGPRQQFSEYSGVVSIFINQALDNQPITVDGDGSQRRSLIHVDDIVRATILAGETPAASGKTINLSGASTITILELAHLVKRNAPNYKSDIVHRPPRIGDVRESIGSTAVAESVLGFRPEITLGRGLRLTVDWYRSKRPNA